MAGARLSPRLSGGYACDFAHSFDKHGDRSVCSAALDFDDRIFRRQAGGVSGGEEGHPKHER
jgi:hypothetical protein